MNTANAKYTWAPIEVHSYVECHLDRAFCSSNCFDFWQSISYVALRHHRLDHNLILINLMASVISGPKPFRFQSMWVLHDFFLEVVKQVWAISLVGDLMTHVMHRLKLFRGRLHS